MRWRRGVFGRHRRSARGSRRQWRRDPVDDFGDIAGEGARVQGSVLRKFCVICSGWISRWSAVNEPRS